MRKFFFYFGIFCFALILFLLSCISILLLLIPSEQRIRSCFQTSMHQVEICPESPDYITLDEISQSLVQAVVLAEDASFYQHRGFDWFEIHESLSRAMTDSGRVRGASTISQQLARNLFLSSERTLTRKIREALITLRLESVLSKEEILEKYLNVIEFGEEVFGIRKAAQFYFATSPADLSPLQSAFLAQLLPNPSLFSQGFRSGELSQSEDRRIRRILRLMHRFGRISQSELEQALFEIDFFPGGAPTQGPIHGPFREEEYLLDSDITEIPDDPTEQGFDGEYDDRDFDQEWFEAEERQIESPN